MQFLEKETDKDQREKNRPKFFAGELSPVLTLIYFIRRWCAEEKIKHILLH